MRNALQRPEAGSSCGAQIEEGGQPSDPGTALVGHGVKMDDVIFEEFQRHRQQRKSIWTGASPRTRASPGGFNINRSGTRRKR